LFKLRPPADGFSSHALIVLVALFVVVFANQTLFSRLFAAYPPSATNVAELASVGVVFFTVNVLLLALVCFGRGTKPVLIAVLIVSSATACFIDSYGIVINDEMLTNVAQTNLAEAADLLTPRLLAYGLGLGLLPAFVVARLPLRRAGWRRELAGRGKLVAVLLLVSVALVIAFSSFYASLVRKQKPLRVHANPAYALHTLAAYLGNTWATPGPGKLTVVGADAHIPASDVERELIVLVVGETARADRFSLNGHARETNPELAKAGVISFGNFHACGTSTAVSVPCMFSAGGMASFDNKAAGNRENLLDVLRHAGVNVLWLDNNSDSKGVAVRVPYENYKSPAVNPVCDAECRDVGMLARLQDYVDAHPTGDIVIVLHQMGNHGPSYFKRYPAEFEKFTPTCRSSDLSRCTREEIGNAYDNAIRYTDYFLARTIDFLKRNDARFETAMLYVSDHGESLGENGLYLHGLPRALAPDSQVHVPAILWLGSGMHDFDQAVLHSRRNARLSHDNVFHTVLGLMEIQSDAYRPELDIVAASRRDR